LMGLAANLTPLFTRHTPPPIGSSIQELAQNTAGTVLLCEIELHSRSIRG